MGAEGERLSPTQILLRMGGALIIGTAGGALFAYFKLPLAWMIGAMVFTTVATLLGLPLVMSRWIRAPMVAILGVMLGSAFTPAIAARLPEWIPTIAALGLYVAVTCGVLQLYFRKIGGFDRTTAFFSSSPGGLSEMVLVGGAMGGDERIISLVHGARVLLVVMVVPFSFVALGLYERGSRPSLGPSIVDEPLLELAILGACALVGGVGARLLRIPAAMVTGPMAISAAVHLAGLTEHRPPAELVAAAQVVIGTAIGCRFAGTAVRLILRILALSVGSTVIMLAITVDFALALMPFVDASVAAIVLAFAPGGLAEMSLIALALSIDAAFVATHHILRIAMLVIAAPAYFRWRRRREERTRAENQEDRG
jgi:membrane AbrB-like protein